MGHRSLSDGLELLNNTPIPKPETIPKRLVPNPRVQPQVPKPQRKESARPSMPLSPQAGAGQTVAVVGRSGAGKRAPEFMIELLWGLGFTVLVRV